MSPSPPILLLGLLLALAGAPALLAAFKFARVDSLSNAPRLALWLLASVVLAIAITGSSSWKSELGIALPTGLGLLGSALAILLSLAAWPLLQRFQRFLGGAPSDQSLLYRKIVSLPVAQRLFIVLTAAVVEELLYRGYAIGMGELVLGNLWGAFAISVVVFVLGHFSWGVSHLLSVLWITMVLSLLFLVTHDLFACVVTHAVVDSVGFLLAPAIRQHLERSPGNLPLTER